MASVDSCKGLSNTICGLTRRAQHVCLPNSHYRPPRSFESTLVFAIAPHVALHLSDPVCGIVAPAEPCEAIFKIAAMPEVAIAEDHDAFSGEHDIRAAWQPGNVEAITKAPTPQLTT